MQSAGAAMCPPVTVADDQGIVGESVGLFELAEFESKANCKLTFQENPEIGALNGRIQGNPDLPPVEARIPTEPLVVAPYFEIGKYGGIMDVLSNATEAGTSDVLSLRHVNLVRYSDDIGRIVPDVARGWQWNDDFTQLTFSLREGHKWSDGVPFTAEDVAFWFNDLILNSDIYPKTPSAWLWDGTPATVEAVDATTVRFSLPVPAPGLLNRFAISFIQPFQPKHFLGQFMEKHNPDAAKLREQHGFANAAEAVNFYYGSSDWKDVPSPILKDRAKAESMPQAVVPTLESHLLVNDDSKGRLAVANPYFFMVDTAGNQLPYYNEINEVYVPEKEVRNLKLVNGEVDYKMQNLFLDDFPLYKQNEGNGNYSVHLTPTVGEAIYYAFNTNDANPALQEVFSDVRFRQAMSLAIDRSELIDLVYLGQGVPMQATPAEPGTVEFLADEHLTAFTEYDPDRARALLAEIGLEDSNGDGTLETKNGEEMVIQMFFANQGGPIKNHELVAGYWGDVGVKVTLREISTDDYRAKGGQGDLSIASWRDANRAAPTISQDPFMFVPPFGGRWQPGTGYDWANWV
jgi:peptide/nickel transport system substrate-binding protein